MKHEILIIGQRGIRVLRYTVDRANSRFGERLRVIYIEDFIKNGFVELSLCDGGTPILGCGTERIPFSRVKACYALFWQLPRRVVEQGLISEADWHPCRSRVNALIVALQIADGLIINRPLLDIGNASKSLQVLALRKYGFRVPQTLSTNSPQHAIQFAESLGWRVIYKSMGASSIVNRLSTARLSDLQAVRTCPVLFQEEISGPDVRVHVVGERAFAEKIEFSGGVDARHSPRASRRFEPIELPADIEARCLVYVAESGLSIAGFDFKIDSLTGEYVCLECNPMPGYDVYDFRCGGQISDALFDLMEGG